jgi:hypothetical protein
MSQRSSGASAAAAAAAGGGGGGGGGGADPSGAADKKFVEKAERVAEAIKNEHDPRNKIAEDATKPMPAPVMTPTPASETSKRASIEAEVDRMPAKKGLFAQLL